MQLVAIKWQDAQWFDDWVEKDVALSRPPKICHAAGWFVGKEKKNGAEYVVLAALRDENCNVVSARISIPMGDILVIKHFGEVFHDSKDRKDRKK